MSGDAPATDPARDTADVVRSRGAAKTFSDMARSLGLMAVVIAALLLLGPARTLVFPGGAKMQPVDYSDQVRAFARVAGTVLAPVAVPKSWRANAATFDSGATGARLHIGFATPGSGFAGLDETDGDARACTCGCSAGGARRRRGPRSSTGSPGSCGGPTAARRHSP